MAAAGVEKRNSALAAPGDKRPADGPPVVDEEDVLSIQPLGAGQEVGRSCHILRFKGKVIMLDCGIHPAYNGQMCLPFTDIIDAEEIDIILISHFHLDHCGALPWFLEKTTFKGRVFMTHATKAIYRWLLADYVKVSNIAVDQQMYDERDIVRTMDRIETIYFHQEVNVGGVHFTAFHAGHVLGAAMFQIEIAGVKVLYTGDYSREEDRHLMAAELPTERPNILITEATYGTHNHESRKDRENRFTGTVHETVQRGGRCLIPVFALGRAQELLLILDEYWQAHPELHTIPIYYASALAKRCMSVYQTYIGSMNKRIQEQIKISNPFQFRHISSLKGMGHFEDSGPAVVLASPGMLQSGLSRELFEMWCSNRKNSVVLAGYAVEGTLAKELAKSPNKVQAMSGQTLEVNLGITAVSFSAHVDCNQNLDFIRRLQPPHVVLVHAEANEMGNFKVRFLRETENTEYTPTVDNPANTEKVELYFRGEKMAKVVGKAAAEHPRDGQKVSGILIRRNFAYNIIAPDDMTKLTDLTSSTITQRQALYYPNTFALLEHCLGLMYGPTVRVGGRRRRAEQGVGGRVGEEEEAEEDAPSPLADAPSPGAPVDDHEHLPALMVMDKVRVIHDEQNQRVLLEWVASAENDIWADSVLATVLNIDASPAAVKHSMGGGGSGGAAESDVAAARAGGVDDLIFGRQLRGLLATQFGSCTFDEEALTLEVRVDGEVATVTLPQLEVVSASLRLRKAVTKAAARLRLTLHPFAERAGGGAGSAVKEEEEEEADGEAGDVKKEEQVDV